jgi:hypothetical protein
MGSRCRIIQTPGSRHYYQDVAKQLAWSLCSRDARPLKEEEGAAGALLASLHVEYGHQRHRAVQ